MEITSMNFESTDGTDLEKYDASLKALMVTPEGTMPGSRGFGLKRNFMSKTPEEAANILAVEMAEKVAEFIPEIEVLGVEGDPKEGGLKANIFIGRRV